MSEKRVRVVPVRFLPWKEGDKHAPMAIRKQNEKEAKMKMKMKMYQQEYRQKKKLEKLGKLEKEANEKSSNEKPKNVKEKLKIEVPGKKT